MKMEKAWEHPSQEWCLVNAKWIWGGATRSTSPGAIVLPSDIALDDEVYYVIFFFLPLFRFHVLYWTQPEEPKQGEGGWEWG